ncbi:MAG: hypothetical protein U5K84_04100 [Alkalibacterium sp.]|nr:hypothetical protein [Alkalibacterium sp.]
MMTESCGKWRGLQSEDYYTDNETEKGEILFEVKDLSDDKVFTEYCIFMFGEARSWAYSSVLMGAGRTEYHARVFFGESTNWLQASCTWTVKKSRSNHRQMRFRKRDRIFNGETRKGEGLILDDTPRENISLPSIAGVQVEPARSIRKKKKNLLMAESND